MPRMCMTDTAFFPLAFMFLVGAGGCSIKEESRRIEVVRLAEIRRQAASGEELTGGQVFIRSCNTCHPSGRAGRGPSLAYLGEHFPDDESLKAFIRQGTGLMPPQTDSELTDSELERLVAYLRELK